MFLAFAGVALAALAGLGVYWRSVGRFVSDSWVKVVAKSIQLPVLIVSGHATYVAAKRDEWFAVAIAGGTCALLWEIVALVVDGRVKAIGELDKATLEAAEQESEARTELLTAFREAVNEKVRRLMRATRNRG